MSVKKKKLILKERDFFNEDNLFVYCLFEEYRKRFEKGSIYNVMNRIKEKEYKGKSP